MVPIPKSSLNSRPKTPPPQSSRPVAPTTPKRSPASIFKPKSLKPPKQLAKAERAGPIRQRTSSQLPPSPEKYMEEYYNGKMVPCNSMALQKHYSLGTMLQSAKDHGSSSSKPRVSRSTETNHDQYMTHKAHPHASPTTTCSEGSSCLLTSPIREDMKRAGNITKFFPSGMHYWWTNGLPVHSKRTIAFTPLDPKPGVLGVSMCSLLLKEAIISEAELSPFHSSDSKIIVNFSVSGYPEETFEISVNCEHGSITRLGLAYHIANMYQFFLKNCGRSAPQVQGRPTFDDVRKVNLIAIHKNKNNKWDVEYSLAVLPTGM